MEEFKRNGEGYLDPTACAAMRNIQREEVTRLAAYVMKILQKYLEAHGFVLIGKISMRHIKSGRNF